MDFVSQIFGVGFPQSRSALKLDQKTAQKTAESSPKTKTGWWQLKYFLFSLLFGEDSQFD